MEHPQYLDSSATTACAVARKAFQCFVDLSVKPQIPTRDYPHISSIPQTPTTRLTSASPTPCPDEPVLAASSRLWSVDSTASTVLYLAYGSNLSAETFLGRRGIRPLSQVNVSAPSLRLTFDLPGIPYKEPCFSNTALRKVPKLPQPPPKLPDPPDLRPPNGRIGGMPGDLEPPRQTARGDPVWDKGLIGVVYEVTQEDFAKIVRTEGGGVSYRDILVPCFPLPARVGVPEKPPIPELPKPFLAHTLYAPQMPSRRPDDDDEQPAREPADPINKIKDWWRKLLLHPVRADSDYAQPSPRYLKLIRDGAREHELPDEYQAWLASLQPYTITTLRQRVGQVLFLCLMVPLVLAILTLDTFLADKDGKVPVWLGVLMSGLQRLAWIAYDRWFKPYFGDGERTTTKKDDGDEVRKRASWLRVGGRRACTMDEEKRGLLEGVDDH